MMYHVCRKKFCLLVCLFVSPEDLWFVIAYKKIFNFQEKYLIFLFQCSYNTEFFWLKINLRFSGTHYWKLFLGILRANAPYRTAITSRVYYIQKNRLQGTAVIQQPKTTAEWIKWKQIVTEYFRSSTKLVYTLLTCLIGINTEQY